jgi:transcriptional regulator with XRE-family HTH domain
VTRKKAAKVAKKAVPLDPAAWDQVVWEGRTYSEIGRELGVTRQAVAARADVLGKTPHVPEPEIVTPAADASIRVIAGWRIRQHRAARRWRLEDLARAVNGVARGGSWSKGPVLSVERAREDQRGLTIPTLYDFAEALAVTPADLLLRPGQDRLVDEPVLEAAWGKLVPPYAGRFFEIIGLNISLWRLRRGWSPRELGDRAGARTATRISEIERGSYPIALPTLEVFAEALSLEGQPVTPADLVRLPRQTLAAVKSG